MYGKTMLGLEYVRSIKDDWGEELPTPAPRLRPTVAREPMHERLARSARAGASRIPSRHEALDWFGRRLITWGWQLRMHYGSRGR